MYESRYLISDAADEINVDIQVLKHWEEELDIQREDMSDGYYSDGDINQLRSVRDLVDKGFQLRAIKLLLPRMDKVEGLDEDRLMELRTKLNEALGIDEETTELTQVISTGQPSDNGLIENSRMNRFRDIMGSIMQDVLIENNDRLTEDLTKAVKYSVIKEIDYLFRTKEEQEEERYRKFDRLIRDMQQSRQQAAAASEGYIRKKTRR